MEITCETYFSFFLAKQNEAPPGISVFTEQVSIISEHQNRINYCVPELLSSWGHYMAAHQGADAQLNGAVWKAGRRRALLAKARNFLMVMFLLWERVATQYQQCVYKQSEYADQAGKYLEIIAAPKWKEHPSTMKGKFSVCWGKLYQCPIYREPSWNINVERMVVAVSSPIHRFAALKNEENTAGLC